MIVERYALFGHPVAHSKSPAIHRAFAEQTGQSLTYELIDTPPESFRAAVTEFFAHGGRGANVTLPHKELALQVCDALSPRARAAGAVNTLKREADGSLLGDNTDGAGLVRDLTRNHGVPIRGRRVLLCGAGGAARGALEPLLAERPALLLVVNRTPERARRLVARFPGARFRDYPALAGETFDLVINATSGSLRDELPPLPEGLFAPGACAYDMVYLDRPTAFMDWARARGAARVLDGWGMMVEQAAESFLLWRGLRPATGPLLQRF